MTYCVGILLREGFVLAADSRTSAGVDHISTFRKLFVFQAADRFMALMSAGNLATAQAVITMVSERLEEGTDQTSLFRVPTMFNAARIVGNALREVVELDGPGVRGEGADPTASFLLAGQINGRNPRLFQIYTAGNFIEAMPETPFLQIGETKYGKPILDRIVDYEMPLRRAAKAALISFDSTMRSNISVGPPIDLIVYRRDAFRAAHQVVIEEGNRYFQDLRRRYGEGLLRVFDRLPEPPLE